MTDLNPVFQGIVEAHSLARLVRAADHVAGAETDAPNFEPFMEDLQKAVEPFRQLIALPQVGQIVQYFNPSYAPADNDHTGVGPYAAIVTKAWEYGNSTLCNLAVITPGKDAVTHVRSVPEQGSDMDDAKYPSWAREQVCLPLRDAA
jgi:hypothetical protein